MNFIKRKEKQCNKTTTKTKKAKANNFELNQINLLTISKRIINI